MKSDMAKGYVPEISSQRSERTFRIADFGLRILRPQKAKRRTSEIGSQTLRIERHCELRIADFELEIAEVLQALTSKDLEIPPDSAFLPLAWQQ